MVKQYRISDLAKEKGVTVQTAHRHFRRIGGTIQNHVSREKGITFLDEEGAKTLLNAIGVSTLPAYIPTVGTGLDLATVTGELNHVKQALLAVVEELKASRQDSATIRAEVSAIRAENQVLRSEVIGVRLALMAPADPPRQVIAWRPEPRPDPAEVMTWLERLWVEFTDPGRLRRFEV
ncbi:MAG: hypothetical protein Q8O19_00030 [Rectinemataceae bacterium]|nr:hypothetical protein [Rectinemataceae bacterium]